MEPAHFDPNFWGTPGATPGIWDFFGVTPNSPQIFGAPLGLSQKSGVYPKFTPIIWGQTCFTPRNWGAPQKFGVPQGLPQKFGVHPRNLG